jgi:hypothetical protein
VKTKASLRRFALNLSDLLERKEALESSKRKAPVSK